MDPAVVAALGEFVNAASVDAQRHVFSERSSLLLSPDGFLMLEANAQDPRQDGFTRRAMAAWLRVFGQPRSRTLAAFDEADLVSEEVLRFLDAPPADLPGAADPWWRQLWGSAGDLVFAQLLLEERPADELELIATRWDQLLARRDEAIDPVAALERSDRWSTTARLLVEWSAELLRPEALTQIQERAERADAEARPRLEQRAQLLAAALRFGLAGAYASAQGYGRSIIVSPGVFAELGAVSDDAELPDLFDRHPELLRVARKLRGEDASAPVPVNVSDEVLRVISSIEAVASASPTVVVERLSPLPGLLDAALLPDLYGLVHLRLADAHAKLDRTEAGMARALDHFKAAESVFTADRYPIDYGETKLVKGQAALRHGHVTESLVMFDDAAAHLDVAACDDTLLMAVRSRTPREITLLRRDAELRRAEALWRMGRRTEAREEASAIERASADDNPEWAAQACVFLARTGRLDQDEDPDAHVHLSEQATRRGLAYLGAEPDNQVATALAAELVWALDRAEERGMTARVAEAKEVLAGALASADRNTVSYGYLEVAEHDFINSHDRTDGWQERARACADEVRRVADHLGSPELVALAEEALGDDAPAGDDVEHYADAIAAFETEGDGLSAARVLRRVADLHFARDEWRSALDAYERAIVVEPPVEGDLIAAYRHSARVSRIYANATWSALECGEHARALQLCELGKARFLKALASPLRRGNRPVEEALEAIAPGTIVVVPVMTERGVRAFVLRGGDPVVAATDVIEIDLGARDWTVLTDQWVHALERLHLEGDIDAWEEHVAHVCRELWDGFMRSIRDCITGLGAVRGTRVLFAPPNLLAPLPFHAARDAEGRHPFAEHFVLTYAPGITLLPEQAPDITYPRMLAFIDPDQDLPFAAYEASVLREVMRGSQLRLHEGPGARTEFFFERVERLSYHFVTHLHFACHGFNDMAHPLRSGIKLADGGLGAASFLQPDVKLETVGVVALSACESGVSSALHATYGTTTMAGGEEYIGLPAALLAAGVPWVISTLWPVEDYVAARFFEEFYRRHLREKLDCVRAFDSAREAIREMTTAHVLADVEERLLAADPDGELHAVLRDMRAFVTEHYSGEERPFDEPAAWAAFVLSGADLARQA